MNHSGLVLFFTTASEYQAYPQMKNVENCDKCGVPGSVLPNIRTTR